MITAIALAVMVRIGIILTDPDFERQKLELVRYSKSNPDELPWNKHVPEEAVTKRTAHMRQTGSSHGIASDMAVGAFVKHAYQKHDVDVDFIRRDEITVRRLKSNDLNFVLIYDLLECFHMDPTKKKTYYREMKACLEKAGNIYPPLEEQKFLGSKIAYYRFFKDNGIPILPTVTMTSAEYKALGHQKAVQHILDQVKSGGWGKFCAKPEYGQDGRDFKFFQPRRSKGLDNHVRFCMSKYPGIIFQKMVKGFGKNLKGAEMRMYYCGSGSSSSSKYNHAIVACAGASKTRVFCLEKGKDKQKLQKRLPVALLKRASRRVIKTLPKPVMPDGIRLPRLVNRVDMGYNIEGVIQPFVNEVEFCPSYYVEDAPLDRTVNYIKSIGKQMVRITRLYAKKRALLRKPSPSHHLKQQKRQK